MLNRYTNLGKITSCLAGLLLLLTLFPASRTQAQSSITFDTEYWFAAPYTTSTYWGGTAFRISAFNDPATVTISVPLNGAFLPKTVTVPAGSTETVVLTAAEIGQVINTTGNGIMPTGILLETSARISVYYESGGGSQSPDLISLKGSQALGTEFIVPMQQASSLRDDAAGQQGFVVVATEDNTQVTITPKAAITGRAAGVPFTVMLNRGQTYFGQTPGPAPGVSGSTVNSDKPVAVTIFSELMRYGPNAADLGAEQLVPLSNLGTEYLVVRGYRTTTDIVYFTAAEDNTEIRVNGTLVATLNATDTYELQTGTANAFHVVASKVVSALQLSGIAYEESFSLLPPLSTCSGSNTVSVVRANNGDFYVNIVSPANTGFLVNGNASLLGTPVFTALGATGWYYARVAVPAALVSAGNPVIVSNTDPDVRFQVGVFHTNSGGARYGYFSSYSSISVNFNQAAATLCEGGSVTFTPTVLSTDPVTSYSWTGPGGFTSSEASITLDNVTPAQSGQYVLQVSTGSCTVQASVNLTVNAAPAAPVSGGNQYVCAADPVQTLTATATVPASDKITWYDAAAGGNVVADPSLSSVGTVTYYAEARNGTQCVSTSRTPVTLSIEAGPDIDPLGDQLACGAYELPLITGSNLTGNEAYFTGPGGTGTRYEPGDLIATAGATQLYIYDKAASVANCDGNLTATPNTTLSPDHPLYSEVYPPYPGTIDAAFWAGTSDQIIQYTIQQYDQLYHTIVSDLSIGNTADCFGTEVRINTSVTVENQGPDNGAGYPGRIAIVNKANGEILYSTNFLYNFPANTSGTYAVTGVVPLAELAGGNVGILISLETTHGNLVKNWKLSDFSAGYTFIPENTVGCADEETFTVTVGPALPAPVSGGDQEEAFTGQTLTATATLPAGVPAGATIVWYDSFTGGNLVADPSLSTNGTVTYYAEIQSGNCRGPRTPVKLTLTPLPPEICGNGIDDDGNGVADCDDPACNPYANYFANGSLEQYTQCPGLSGAGTLAYVNSWKTSLPAPTQSGGQLMVNDPATGCVSPRPHTSWTASTNLPAGSEGLAWGGMHGGALGQPHEDFQNTLVAPLPAGTYTFKFSAGYLTQGPFTGPGRFRFYGIQPGEADFTTAHPLGFSPMINNAISAGNPTWKEYSLTFTSTQTYDRIYIVAYSGPANRSYMVFDGFSMSFNTPEIAFQNQIASCAGSAVLEVTNPDPLWTGYQWYLAGEPISGATGATYAPAAGQGGTYTVSGVTAEGCFTASSAGIPVSNDCPVPFVCNGSAYLVSTPNATTPSTLSIVAANNPNNVHATLTPSLAEAYNGIGYNFEDNLIYGYVTGITSPALSGEIVQIDGEGTVKRLGKPTSTQVGRGMETWTTDATVNPNGAVVTLAPGVVGLDNKFYAMVVTNSATDRYLATVDLTTMTYTTVKLSGNYISADLAFSPYDGMLYGLAGNNQLARTNPTTGNQQIVTPTSGTPPLAGAGGAWNDIQGRVYFYTNGGTPAQGGQRLFRYNPANGVFVNVTGVTAYPGFDATACFPTSMEKSVVMPAGGINPGDVVEMQFSIYNSQILPMTYEFEDVLTSSDLSWVADAVLPASPGGGTVTISGQTLRISGITVPPSAVSGPLTFTVSLKVADNATHETCYTNQATLTLGGMTVYSDDPSTAEADDPTEFCLNPCTVTLTVGQLSCDPASGTYSVSYISNGAVTSTAGTVDMANNMITGIPLGTDITVTSSCSGSSVTANVTGLTTCPDNCILPDLALGQPLCGPGGTFIVSYKETTGAVITVTGGTDNGDGTITGTMGTPLTVTASNGACTSTLTTASPVGCDVPCKNPAISIGGVRCSADGSATYEIVFTALAGTTVTSDQGTVDIAGGVVTGIPLGTDARLTIGYQSCPDLVVVVPSAACLREFTTRKTVTEADADGLARAGEELTYIISIQNTGDVNLTGLAINDVIPAGTAYLDGSADNGGTHDAAAGALNWTVNVPAGTTLDVSFKVTVNDNLTGIAEIANKATVTDPQDPDNPEEPESPPVPTDPIRDFDPGKSVVDASGDGNAQAGEELTYTISIENTGNVDLTGFAVSDPIPAGTSYLDGSADNGGVFDPATEQLDWTVDIPFGTTLNITFKVTVDDNLTGVDEIANKATITDPEDPDNPEEPESPPVPTDPVRDFDPDKSVTDASGDGNAQAGEELTYTISIENTGNVDLTGFAVSDPIPAGTSYLNGSADNGGVFDPATGRLDWTVDIPYGETINITFKVTVNDNLTGVDEIANQATVTDPENPGNPEEPESPPVPTDPVRDFDPDKSVTDADGDGKAQAGEELTYTISIENTGNVDLTGLLISDPIPAGTSYLDGSADNGGVIDPAAGQLDWTVDVPYGETISISFKVTVNDNLTGIAEIANKATITDPEDPGKPKEPESPPIPADPVRDFDTDKSVADANGDGKAQAGEELTYTIRIENTGDVDLTGLLITDPIPDGTAYLDGSADNGGALDDAAGDLNWTVDVPYGETLSLHFKVTVNENVTGISEITNKATVTDPENPGNPKEPETPPVPVEEIRDFDSQKTVIDASGDGKAQAGEELTYTISIENTGNVDLDGLQITDPIPAGSIYLEGSADNGGTFSEADNRLDWTVSVPFGETLEINFKVRVSENLTGITEIANKAIVTDPEDPDNPEEPETPPVPADVIRDFETNKTVADAGGDGNARAGEEMTYTITIENTGNVDLTGFTITDQVPDNTEYIEGSADNGGAFEDNELTWTVDVPFGESKSVSFKVTVAGNLTGIDQIANTATVRDPENPDDPREPSSPDVPVFIPDPIANDDEGEVETGDQVVIAIMDNDETDGSPLDPTTVEIIDEPLHGTLTVHEDGTITYTPDPNFAGRDNFTYRVRDEDGNWSNVAVVDITVVARPLSIPNLFTPNGDGRNDTFEIPGLEGFPDNELFIVNRWGNEVFRQVNYQNTWTGEGLNEGTYYYVLRIRNAAGEEQVYKGYITLVRAFGK